MSKKSKIADAKGLIRRHDKMFNEVVQLAEVLRDARDKQTSLTNRIVCATTEFDFQNLIYDELEAQQAVDDAKKALQKAEADLEAVKAKMIEMKEWRPSPEVVKMCEDESANQRVIDNLLRRKTNLEAEIIKINNGVRDARKLLDEHKASLALEAKPEAKTVVVEQPFKAPRAPLLAPIICIRQNIGNPDA